MRSLAVVITALVGGCSKPPDPEVAFVVADPDELVALQSAIAGVPSIGFATTDATEQRASLDRAIQLGVRVIVLEPLDASPDTSDFVVQAHQRGVRIVAYGREPTGHGDHDTVDALVAFDGFRAGTLQVAAALAAIQHGRVAIVDTPSHATGVAAEIARAYALTLAPYIARGDVTLVDDPASADAILATSGSAVRSLGSAAGHAFVTSVGGDNTDLVCASRQQLDIRLDRADLAAAAGTIVRRIVAGEDLGKDPQAIRLPNRRLPVELAPVREFTTSDCISLVTPRRRN
ncbi:MAG: substrate-binding domain-containing protein [Kofleriaceae bacterium]